MQLKTTILLCLFTIGLIPTTIAQDVDFTQWQANYMAFNPAMTGISNNPRIHFAHRFQPVYFILPNNEHQAGRTTTVSYDQRISPKGGYIGVSYMNDMIGSAQFGTQSVMLNYARNYSIDISAKAGNENFSDAGKLNLRFGIALGGFERSISGEKLRLTDQYNPRTGVTYQSYSRIPSTTIYTGIRPNFGIGTAMNYNNFYAGFAIHNILESMDAFGPNPTTRLPRRYSANAGAFLPLNPANEKTAILAPHIVFQRQNNIAVLQPGLNFNKGIFTGGASYRYSETHISNLGTRKAQSINFLLGISKGMFKTAYNYDYNLNNTVFIKAVHEISLSVYLGKHREGNDKEIPYYYRKMGF